MADSLPWCLLQNQQCCKAPGHLCVPVSGLGSVGQVPGALVSESKSRSARRTCVVRPEVWAAQSHGAAQTFPQLFTLHKGRSQPPLGQILNSRFWPFRETKSAFNQTCGLKALVAALQWVQRHFQLGKPPSTFGWDRLRWDRLACLPLVPFSCHPLLATLGKMPMARLSLPRSRADAFVFVLDPNAHHVSVAAEYGATVGRVGVF